MMIDVSVRKFITKEAYKKVHEKTRRFAGFGDGGN